MAQFFTLLTDIGQAKLANAVALGGTIEITELAVGDGGGSLPTPLSSATALVGELRRAPINTSTTDPDNPSWIVVEQVLPPDVGGWTIREIGIYDVDGDLIGIGNYPETYKPVLAEGSSRTQTVRFVLEVSDTAAVTLKVDPSVVLATREYVDDQRAQHEASRNHPAATTTAQGMVEKATTAEAKAGVADKFPDAAAMRAAIDDGLSYQNIAVFDAASVSNWNVPQELQDGRRKAYVIVTGAGGGGGLSGPSGRRGAGGGAGGTAIAVVDLSGVASVSVTVGAGQDGGDGGSSAFGAYLSATGGKGGADYAGANAAGGAGGYGTGGSLNLNGGYGSDAPEQNGTAANSGSGDGGSSYWGGGRRSGSGGGSGESQAPGSGSGGSDDAPRQRGADGIVVVRW